MGSMLRRIITLIGLILLFTNNLFAQQNKFVDKTGKEWGRPQITNIGGKFILDPKYKSYAKEEFSTRLNIDGYYETVAKPNIIEDKLLTETESEQVKAALWNDGLVDDTNKVFKEGRKLIFKELHPARNDYKHDFDRGTVYYTPLNRNYSFSKVIISDGTVIKNSNFTQRKAGTVAIQGKNLTFIECNLVNVKIDATWTLQDCNNAQIKREIKSQKDNGDGTTEITISHKVYNIDTDKFEEVQSDTEIIPNSELDNALLYYAP